jgi:hypothetical protein
MNEQNAPRVVVLLPKRGAMYCRMDLRHYGARWLGLCVCVFVNFKFAVRRTQHDGQTSIQTKKTTLTHAHT